MKLNISYPPNGSQKCIDIDDELKYRIFYDKRISQEVEGDALGDQFKGYIFKIMGGNDKQGFPMKQGVLTNHRVRLLMRPGVSCYRPRRSGEKKRKSVRGCIVASDIAALHLVIVKKGAEEIPDLTDKYVPRRLGPKRASKIRKLFNLTKEDDVRKYVIRRDITKEGKKKRTKAPKIQRLVTPRVLQHKRERLAEIRKRHEKAKSEAADYAKLVAQRRAEIKAKRAQSISKRRAASIKKDEAPKKEETKPVATTKPAATQQTKAQQPAKQQQPAQKETKPAQQPAKQQQPAPKETKATTQTKPTNTKGGAKK